MNQNVNIWYGNYLIGSPCEKHQVFREAASHVNIALVKKNYSVCAIEKG